MTADIQALPLTYSIELCPFMSSHYSPIRILLITGLFHMMLSRPVSLCLEMDISISDRLRKTLELPVT